MELPARVQNARSLESKFSDEHLNHPLQLTGSRARPKITSKGGREPQSEAAWLRGAVLVLKCKGEEIKSVSNKKWGCHVKATSCTAAGKGTSSEMSSSY